MKERLPEIEADGYSEYVLVYCGHRTFPEIANYCPTNTTLIRGTRRKKGAQTHWFSNVQDDSDRNGPILEPTHWCKIEYPKE